METDMIVLNEFCSSHQVEISFIQSLEEHGLIETVIVDQSICIYANELPKLERIVRLHRELNINPEGIDVINELLKKMEDMQHKITNLKNRLDFYMEES
jgi:chaperone modulatory protein CbpM